MLVVLTGIQLVIGELVPKALALQYPTETALATVFPMRASLWLFRPFLALLNGTATLILRLFGSRMEGHHHLHSPEEIELLIAESRDGGLLEPKEQQRLHRALRLGRRTARDLDGPARQSHGAPPRRRLGRRGAHGRVQSVQPVAGLPRLDRKKSWARCA